MNANKLRGKITERGMTVGEFCEKDFIQPTFVTDMRTAQEGGPTYIIRTADASEFFLLENRQKDDKWNESLPGHGMIVYRVDLTSQKVWNDNNNENGARPDEIKVAIYRQAYDENGAKQGDPEQYTVGADSDGWFIISADDHEREDSATWTRVIKDLPVVVENGNTYTYYTYEVREAPVIGYTSDITHQEKESTPIAKITNTPEKFVIEFKYYDRYHDHSSYAGINDKETIYQFELDGIPRDFVTSETVDDQEKVYIDFAGLIGQKAVEFSNEGLGVKNLICDYDLWTSQKAAVTALSTDHYSYFEKGVPIHYNTQIPPEGSQAENPLEYHTDYLGKLPREPR